jgi:hypothetical protein
MLENLYSGLSEAAWWRLQNAPCKSLPRAWITELPNARARPIEMWGWPYMHACWCRELTPRMAVCSWLLASYILVVDRQSSKISQHLNCLGTVPGNSWAYRNLPTTTPLDPIRPPPHDIHHPNYTSLTSFFIVFAPGDDPCLGTERNTSLLSDRQTGCHTRWSWNHWS